MGLIKVLIAWAIVAIVWSLDILYGMPALDSTTFGGVFLGIFSFIVCCLVTFGAADFTEFEFRPQVG
jgi:hypothetical protein